MSDMKVRIIVEDADGRRKSATLSFEEKRKVAKKKRKTTVIDRMRKAGFTVRLGMPEPEPGMIGEIHAEPLDGPRDICRHCMEHRWVLSEVVEDGSEEAEPEYPFIAVEHDLIGELCIACGRFEQNEDMLGTGIFGLWDEKTHGTMQDFLEAIRNESPEESFRIRHLQALLAQERLHLKALFRIRQRLTELRIEKAEGRVLEMREEEE